MGRAHSRASRRRRARDGWAACRADVERSTPHRPRRRPPGLEWRRRGRRRHLRAAGCGPGAGARVLRARVRRPAAAHPGLLGGSRTPDGACFAPPRNPLAMSAEAAAREGSHRRCPLSRRRGQRAHRAHGARPRHRTACLAESQPGQRSEPARPDALGGRAAQLRFRPDHRRRPRGPTRQASVQCPGDTIHG